MAFDRWKSPEHCTWAFRVFKAHHTELNRLYWAYVPASQYSIRPASDPLNSHTTIEALYATKGADSRRFAPSPAQWKLDFIEFDNWVRLSALIALNGYFETYIQTVVSLALESDPGVRYRSHKAIDGALLMKNSPIYTCWDEALSCAKGTWEKRIIAYKGFFNDVPKCLAESVTDLEAIRSLRNGIGHRFCRPIDEYKSRVEVKPQSISRLSQVRLQTFWKLIDDVATNIDSHLIHHIGSYEALLYYHTNNASFDLGNQARSMRKQIREGSTVDVKIPGYFKDLITFYRRL